VRTTWVYCRTSCAANAAAAVRPRHRVVRHDGGWSGYRWGT
jgi:AraC family transcriptional regulator of adaptative response/methylated-DNA-[protein]-cysteine methyltransferase